MDLGRGESGDLVPLIFADSAAGSSATSPPDFDQDYPTMEEDPVGDLSQANDVVVVVEESQRHSSPVAECDAGAAFPPPVAAGLP